jgi:hypothetical protein
MSTGNPEPARGDVTNADVWVQFYHDPASATARTTDQRDLQSVDTSEVEELVHTLLAKKTASRCEQKAGMSEQLL